MSAQQRLVVADGESRCAKGGKQQKTLKKWKLKDVTLKAKVMSTRLVKDPISPSLSKRDIVVE